MTLWNNDTTAKMLGAIHIFVIIERGLRECGAEGKKKVAQWVTPCIANGFKGLLLAGQPSATCMYIAFSVSNVGPPAHTIKHITSAILLPMLCIHFEHGRPSHAFKCVVNCILLLPKTSLHQFSDYLGLHSYSTTHVLLYTWLISCLYGPLDPSNHLA